MVEKETLGKGVTVEARPEQFTSEERLLAHSAAGSVWVGRFSSDVEKLTVQLGRVNLVILPFRGQQIWRYRVDGEDLTMATTFAEPTPSTVFGESYGAFLVHCGLTGIGAPGPADSHPHHGELPSAPTDSVQVTFGSDDRAEWIEISSTFVYRSTHAFHIEADISLRLRSNSPIVEVRTQVTNRRSQDLEYAYLCHINWSLDQPLQLLQSVPLQDPDFLLAPNPGQDLQTEKLLSAYAEDLELSNRVDPGQAIVPEYCAVMTPTKTESGQAEFIALRPDATAFWVGYDPRLLPRAVRWVSNTGDERAAGFCLPSTGHHFGRTQNGEDGLLRSLAPGETATLAVQFGLLDEEATAAAAARIDDSI